MRNVFERAWRSSIIALEEVLVRSRSALRTSNRGLEISARWPLSDPLVLSEQTLTEQVTDAPAMWPDAAGAAAGIDLLLRRISTIQIDSKFEATDYSDPEPYARQRNCAMRGNSYVCERDIPN